MPSTASAATWRSSSSARRSDIAGYLELHIEQGVVLQNNKIDLGLVTAIVGITRIEDRIRGRRRPCRHDADGIPPRRHAWRPPQLMLFVAERAREFAGRGKQGHFVATTGILDIRPNAANVVPGRARMVFDIRAEDRRADRRIPRRARCRKQGDRGHSFGVERSADSPCCRAPSRPICDAGTCSIC